MPDTNNNERKAHGELKWKDYEQELARLHLEFVKLQEWVVHKGLEVSILFEGRDGAGKGGTIKAMTERVSPRIFRVIALPAPTEREKSQMYAQRISNPIRVGTTIRGRVTRCFSRPTLPGHRGTLFAPTTKGALG